MSSPGSPVREYGKALTKFSVTVVPLWWYAMPLKLDDKLNMSLEGADDHAKKAFLECHGVYAFEGKHDSRPEGGLLYIGRAGKSGCKVGDEDGMGYGQILGKRVRQSATRFLWTEEKEGTNTWGSFADVWDVTVRFAAVADPAHIVPIEDLLIRAHAPSFNAQKVRGAVTDTNVLNLVVMNGGVKGRLLPVVAGAYFNKDLWDKIAGG